MRSAIVFPGQGSQVPGMGRDLYDHDDEARDLYDTASRILGYDLLRAGTDQHGELSDTVFVQPAILVHSVACWRLARRRLAEPPVAMAGHSLGELTALVCAGALRFPEAVRLAERRARLMAACDAGAMAVVFGLPAGEVEDVCRSVDGARVVVANRNSAEQCVISGDGAALAVTSQRLTERSAVVKPIKVGIAAHSPLMAPAAEGFARHLATAGIGDAHITIVSSVGARSLRAPAELRESLRAQLTGCVDWPATVARLRELGVDTIVECGPKTVLCDLTTLDDPGLTAVSCDSVAALRRLGRMTGAPVARPTRASAESVEAFLLGCLRTAVGTPALEQLPDGRFTAEIRDRYRRLRDELDALRGGASPTNAASTHPASTRDASTHAASTRTAPTPAERLVTAAETTFALLRAKGVTAEHAQSLLDGCADAADCPEIPDLRAESTMGAVHAV